MELRYATITDADKLCQFARQAFYDSYAWYNDEHNMATYLNDNFTVAKIVADINHPHTALLLVWDNDILCGYMKLLWSSRPDVANATGKQLEIARLYADKQLIGKGVGKLLMEAAIDFAKKGNADIIWLDVWKENWRAIQFYTKWGFEIVSDWTFVLGKDKQEDYIMVKELV
jgi:ribosomal protein S18 acetylase RimI-like enzyme